MNKFSSRMLIAFIAVAGLTTACGKNQANPAPGQQAVGEPGAFSVITKTDMQTGDVSVAFVNEEPSSQAEVESLEASGEVRFVPLNKVMNKAGSSEDFSFIPYDPKTQKNSSVKSLSKVVELGRRGRRRAYRRGVRHGRRQARRRARRRSHWYGGYYAPLVNYFPPAYVSFGATSCGACSTAVVSNVNSCGGAVFYSNGCVAPYSTSLGSHWSFGFNFSSGRSSYGVWF